MRTTLRKELDRIISPWVTFDRDNDVMYRRAQEERWRALANILERFMTEPRGHRTGGEMTTDIIDVTTGEATEVVLTHSPSIDKISAALVAAQGAMEGVGKDATNPHFGSKYATLGAIWKMARPHLLAHGIAVVQAPTTVKDGDRRVVKLETTLLHTSGQWLRSAIEMPIEKPTAQGVGSAITYACRYSMAPLLGITTGEDDDGNEASTSPAAKPKAGDDKTEIDDILGAL